MATANKVSAQSCHSKALQIDVYIGHAEVISIFAHDVPPKWESTHTELTKTNQALNAIRCIIPWVPAPGSPDYKPDDPEYKAVRAKAFSTLEAFSQFLSTSAAIELVSEVCRVFYVLREHGEKAGLLSPLLIRAMSGYLDEYKKAHGELPWYFRGEEWIETLYSNLKPEDSGQVCLLPFSSYESALTSNSTLIQNPHAAVVASASTNVDDSGNPQVHSASVAADTATHRASATITSVETTDSARPEVSRPEASPLTSFPAPSTAQIQETASVERTQGVPRAEDTRAIQEDSGSAQIDLGEVSETLACADTQGVSEAPALVSSGGTSNANPQETELSSTKIPSIPQPAVQLSGKENPSE